MWLNSVKIYINLTKGQVMDDVKKKIGHNLRRLRKAKGLKQSELAELVGVEDKTVSRIEVGGNYPSMDLLVRMSSVLDCQLTDFVNFTDSTFRVFEDLTGEELKVLKKVLLHLSNYIK